MTNSRLSGYLRLRGESTIEIVEKGMLLLSRGAFPARTTESSTNVYRLDYFPPQSIIKRIASTIAPIPKAYRVEIADFAGELTDEFAESSAPPTLNEIPSTFGEDSSSNYLKWVAESDRCLLFIDMEKYLDQGNDFASILTTKYIAFWQKYLDLHSTSMRPRSGTPVVIVHSKCDAIHHNSDPALFHLGQELLRIEEMALKDFRKLYNFLEANSRHVERVYISVLATSDAGIRFGVDDLATAVLPGRSAAKAALKKAKRKALRKFS